MNSNPPQPVACRAQVNAFGVNWRQQQQIFHYDVEFTPQWEDPRGKDIKIGPQKRREVIDRLQTQVQPDHFPRRPVFDGQKSLFSFERLAFGTLGSYNVPFSAPSRPNVQARCVLVTFKLAHEVNPRVLDRLRDRKARGNVGLMAEGSDVLISLTMLNIFVQAQPRQSTNIYKAKSFYLKNTVRSRDSDRILPLQIWKGFFQSIRPTLGGELVLNADVSLAAVMPRGPLENACMEFLKIRDKAKLLSLSRLQLASLRVFFKDLKITINLETQRGKKGRRIKDLRTDCGRYEFTKGDTTTTIKEYYYQVHNAKIASGTIGVDTGNNVVIPITFCFLEEQLYNQRLSPDGINAMLQSVPKRPSDRLEQIRRGWPQLGHVSSEFLAGAGIDIQAEPLQVNGRLLTIPSMFFGSTSDSKTTPVQVDKPGQWNMVRKRLVNPRPIRNILFMCFGHRSDNAMLKFRESLLKALHDLGIRIQSVHGIVEASGQGNVEEALKAAGSSSLADLIIAILPENAPEIYRRIKRFGDITQGVCTQCVRWQMNGGKNNQNQYQNNLALKINAKMGGINFMPKSGALRNLSSVPTMVIGADVSHPGPGSSLPSISSVVASMDRNFCRYAAEIRVQPSRLEIIKDLQEMVKSLLIMFHDFCSEPAKSKDGSSLRDAKGQIVWKSHIVPQRIVFFRDGVSEGQFPQVYEIEYKTALIGAVKSLYAPLGYPQPQFIFCVVGKRHHFRFFPASPDPSTCDSTGNMVSGFVLDTGITHPVFNDFYLQSQAGLKGTSIPSHYTILENTSTLSVQDIQQVAYALCFCYARSTRSVKIPAPVYYADLVCRRSRFHYKDTLEFSDEAQSVVSGERNKGRTAAEILEFYQMNFQKVKPLMAREMYFV